MPDPAGSPLHLPSDKRANVIEEVFPPLWLQKGRLALFLLLPELENRNYGMKRLPRKAGYLGYGVDTLFGVVMEQGFPKATERLADGLNRAIGMPFRYVFQ